MSAPFLFLAAFLACAVEMVEALTIVLAVGVTRGWRSPLVGVGAATLVLAAIVGALGPALTVVPLNTLRLVVGGLLLVFGLQWLRKAVLRSSGYLPLHDEDSIYAREREEAERAGVERRLGTDWYAFTLAFKGVLLEGLEVAFIVIAFSADSRHGVALAAAAAGAALVVVVGVGVAVHAPLSRVPENTLKFAVGLMLTTFGVFWGAEGAGASWPAGDGAIPVILVVLLVAATAQVRLFSRRRARTVAAARSVAAAP